MQSDNQIRGPSHQGGRARPGLCYGALHQGKDGGHRLARDVAS